VGATITAGSNAVWTVDGRALVAGDLVLVKNETARANNGLYVVTVAGSASTATVLTRSVYADTPAKLVGAVFPVSTTSSTNYNTLWFLKPSSIIIGTTLLDMDYLNVFLNTTGALFMAEGGSGLTIRFLDASLTQTASGMKVSLDTSNSLNLSGTGLRLNPVYLLPFNNTADSSTLTNVTVSTQFSTKGTVLANTGWFAGKTYRVTVAGQIVANVAQQIALSLVCGTIGNQSPNLVLAGATTIDFYAEMIVTCRTTGAAGTMHQSFKYIFVTDGTYTSNTNVSSLDTSLDTTVNKDLACSFAATVANNTAVIRHMTVEALN
jgi:hypothetical protein